MKKLSTKHLKKLLSAVLAAAILLCAAPIVASAEDGTVGPLSYEIHNDGVWIVDCNQSASGRLTIPAVIEGYPVTNIDYHAFYNCDSLTDITIPNSVTNIGDRAFSSCYSLTNITIPDSVISIGCDAFYDTGYHNDDSNWKDGVLYIGNCLIAASDFMGLPSAYTIKAGTKLIADDAFSYCDSLTSITIPDSVTSIGEYAFCDCTGLTNVTIPNSVTSIGDRAFFGCDSLTSITVDKNNPNYSSDAYGVLYNKNKTELIQYPIGNTRKVFKIPDSVTSIGCDAFSDCYSLTNITIPDSVASMGDNAFHSCDSLTSITIPNSVTSIGNFAFYYCTSLASITVDKNNPNYSSDAYGVLYNKNKTELIQYPIGNTRKAFKIPDSVTSIGCDAFRDCYSLTNITIPDSVTSIGSGAFMDTGFYNDTNNWEDNVLYIGNYLVEAGRYIWDEETDETIYLSFPSDYTVKYGTKVIADYVFVAGDVSRGYGLESITIPNSVKYIGENIIFECPSFEDVYYDGTEAQWNSIEISTNNDELTNATIHFKGTASVGDVSGDAQINSTDALMVLQYSVGSLSLNSALLPYADVNGDGKVNSSDALLVLQYSVGIINSFPKK